MLEENKTAQRAKDIVEVRGWGLGRVAAIACSCFVLLAVGWANIHVSGAELQLAFEVKAEAAFSTVEGRGPSGLAKHGRVGRACEPAGVEQTQCCCLSKA